MNLRAQSQKPLCRSTAAVLVFAALIGVAACKSSPGSSGLSLILVTLDTTRADRIGAYGSRAVPTPNLDRIASEGVLFETAISPVPLTLPAHSSILTGRYPASHGVRHNGIYRLPEEEVTLAERLRDSGFHTAAVVGAYVLNRGFGTAQGFDVYDDVNAGSGTLPGPDHQLEAQRTADEVNEQVFRVLDGHASERFFLWVHYYDPHMPYAPPERPGRVLEGTGYDREISYVDACFGNLMDRLARDGLLDRSILVVVGDHGESLGEHGEETHGLLLYEGAIHVPFFIRAPGLLPRGKRVDGPVGLTDVVPTVLELLGQPPLERSEGKSLLPRISGTEGPSGSIAFAETLMGRLEYGWSDLYVAREGRFKYIQAPTPELYDLERDPGERENLARIEPWRAEDLAARMQEWLATRPAGPPNPDATRALTPEEESRLRSLGYLAGDAFKGGAVDENGPRPDPKERIEEARRLSTARAMLGRGDLEEALADVEAILAANPRNQKARAARVEALSRSGRFTEAEDEAKAGISLAESDPETPAVVLEECLGTLASAYRAAGKTAEAEATYRRILEKNPRREKATIEIARILVERGSLEEAMKMANGVLSRNSRSGDALSVRLAVETKLERKDDALETATRLAEVQEGDPLALMEAGDILVKSGRPDLGTRTYLAARGQMGNDPLLLGKLGTAHLLTGQLAEARDAFRTLSRLTPGDPRVWSLLGEISLREGNETEARTEFDQALRQDPAFTQPLVTLGRWLAEQDRENEAREVLHDALRRNPQDRQARKILDAM